MSRRARIGVLAVALALSVSVSACGTSSSSDGGTDASGGLTSGPGVNADDKTVTIGILTALSGSAATLGEPYGRGIETFWKAKNAEGGVDGWTVDVTSADSRYEPQAQVEKFQKLAPEIAMLSSFGSPTTQAIQQQLDQEKLLTFPISWDSLWSEDPVLAPLGTPYSIDTANSIAYVVDELGKKNARFGIIYQNDAYGEDSLKGYEAAKAAYGFDDVARATYNSGDTDMTSQVQKMKQAGAEYVIVAALPTVAGPIVGTGASLGYKPRWILQGAAWVPQLVTEDGTEQGKSTPIAQTLAETTWVMEVSAAWGDKQAPGMAPMLAAADKYAPGQTPSEFFTVGYAQGMAQAAILAKAIAAGDLSREGIVDAKLGIGEIDLGGLVPAAHYSATPEPSSRQTSLAEVDPEALGFLKSLGKPIESQVAKEL